MFPSVPIFITSGTSSADVETKVYEEDQSRIVTHAFATLALFLPQLRPEFKSKP